MKTTSYQPTSMSLTALSNSSTAGSSASHKRLSVPPSLRTWPWPRTVTSTGSTIRSSSATCHSSIAVATPPRSAPSPRRTTTALNCLMRTVKPSSSTAQGVLCLLSCITQSTPSATRPSNQHTHARLKTLHGLLLKTL